MSISRNEKEIELANSFDSKELMATYAKFDFQPAEFADHINNELGEDTTFTLIGSGKGNNKNYIVQNNEASIVIQYNDYDPAAFKAKDALMKHSLIAEEYKRTIVSDPDQLARLPDDQKHTADKYCFSYMEKLTGSVGEKTDALHAEGNPDKIIKFAANIGMQASNFFRTCANENIICRDWKAGNLLLRGNDLVFADTKGFCHVDNLSQTTNKAGQTIIDYNVNTTATFLSQHFNDNYILTRSNNAEGVPPGNINKEVWNKEYSYQLGITLDFIMRNEQKLTLAPPDPKQVRKADKGKEPSPEELAETARITNFDFNHPNYNSEEGQRMKVIIEKLCEADPDKRLHYKDAAHLLNVIGNKAKFDDYINVVNKGQAQREGLKAREVVKQADQNEKLAETEDKKSKGSPSTKKFSFTRSISIRTSKHKSSESIESSPSQTSTAKHEEKEFEGFLTAHKANVKRPEGMGDRKIGSGSTSRIFNTIGTPSVKPTADHTSSITFKEAAESIPSAKPAATVAATPTIETEPPEPENTTPRGPGRSRGSGD